MDIKLISNNEEFLSLKKDWNNLAQNSTNKFEWIYSWWLHNQEGNELKILACIRKGAIVGIAPLYIERIRSLKCFTLRKLCFLGQNSSEYMDFFIQQNKDSEKIFLAFLNYIFKKISFDYLDLQQLNSSFYNYDLWEKHASDKGIDLIDSKISTGIDLKEFNSYESYINNIEKKLKRDLRYAQNKFNKIEKAEYVIKSEIEEEDFEIMTNLHLNRQKILYEKGDTSRDCYFIDKNRGDFIKDYFCQSDLNSKLLIYLKFDGKVIAYILLLLNKPIINAFSLGFDTDYRTYSPCKLLFNQLIKYSFENGYNYLDLMRGDENYKFEWINNSTINYNLSKKMNFKTELIVWYKKYVENLIKNKQSNVGLVLTEQ